MTTTVEKTTATTDPAAVTSKKKGRKFEPVGSGGLARRPRVLLPGVLDGAHGVQAGGRRGDQPAEAVLHPDAGSVRGGLRPGHRARDAELVFATGLSTLLVLLLGTPAAFALSLRPVRKTQDALFFFMSTKMLPIVAVILPLYVIVSNIGLLDNIWALVILYTAMNLPIAVWMMRSFFLEVPGELLEAASLDGASLWRSVREVILPLVSPGIAATALICVIFAWNEFFFAVNLTAVNAQTMPVYLVGFIAGEGQYWAVLSAAATMAALPVILCGWFAQNKLVRGLSFGAIK